MSDHTKVYQMLTLLKATKDIIREHYPNGTCPRGDGIGCALESVRWELENQLGEALGKPVVSLLTGGDATLERVHHD